MKTEDESYLAKTYPSFYRMDADLMESLMSFGFECDSGWFPIVKKLSEDISSLLNSYNIPQNAFEVVQVKEKYAVLRYYYQWRQNVPAALEKATDALISDAEDMSAVTCERCSGPGKRTGTGWFKTLCEPCTLNRYNKWK